ncbi:ArnT family glycosyltransferase [Paraglaciecola marina]|uniref:ArnT family glycosyltransferase n=1 Tax=Paraglaciecola marina TaxID=2500157 RepID=UPI00105EEFAC|nr:glycosyltransferase family 39 protein [Paraglaciecola marina]
MNISVKPHPYITTNVSQLLLSSYWPLIITTLSIILVGLGLRDPWPADEPRFALIAKEMIDTGQWFFPARAQELYPDKPPIFMWSIALIYWITGSIRFAFLLPSALCSILTVYLTVDIAKRLWSKDVGLVAGWLLLFSFQFTLQAKTAQIDAMVCAWMTLGCYGLLRFCLDDGQYFWYLIAWFFMGVGVITKGVGFLPLLMLLPYWIYRFQAKQQQPIVNVPTWAWWCGPLAMLLAISLWFIPMLLIVNASDNGAYELYRDNILLKQTVTRYTKSWHHIKPVWYYLVSVIPVFWLPVSLMIPVLIKPWMQAFKALEPRVILPLGYVALVLVFFSISPGKRGVYILPALPVFVLAVAPYYKQLFKTRWLINLMFCIAGMLALTLTITGLMGVFNVEFMTRFASKLELEPWYFFCITGGLGIISLLPILRKNRLLAWPLFMSILWVTYSTYGYQLRNSISTPISIYQEASKYLSEDSKLALVDFSEQFILFSPYTIYHFGYYTTPQRQLLAAYQWQSSEDKYLLLEERLIDGKCYDIEATIDLGFAHRRHWYLVPKLAKKIGCEDSKYQLREYMYQSKL